MVKSTHNKPRLRVFAICLPLVCSLLIPVTVFGDSTSNSQLSEASAELSSTTSVATTQSIDHTNKSSPPTYDKKSTLNEDSRGLSTFLLIGIIINIIMAIIFAWWFSTQWRQSKK